MRNEKIKELVNKGFYLEDEIILLAMKSNKKAIKFASNMLKDNKEFAKKAIEIDPLALSELSDRLKNDKEIVLKAVSKNGFAVKYASKELKHDFQVADTAVLNKGKAIKNLPEPMQQKREIALHAVKTDGLALAYIPYFSSDKEIVFNALHQNGNSYQFASSSIHYLCKEMEPKDVLYKAMKIEAIAEKIQIAQKSRIKSKNLKFTINR